MIFPPAQRWDFFVPISSRLLKSKPVSHFWLYTVISEQSGYFGYFLWELFNFAFAWRLYIKNIHFIRLRIFGGCICNNIPVKDIKTAFAVYCSSV